MGSTVRPHGLPISPAVASTMLHKFLRTPVSAKSASTNTGTPTTPTDPSQPGTPNSGSPNVTTPPISEADFMQLLVTQLQNQDPMNPLQPDQLASELAQFTSVQELAQLNSNSSSQASATASNTQAVEAGMAAGLIGRPVIATGNEVDVSASSGTTRVIADIGGSGGNAVLTLTNAAGQTVGTYKLGTLPGGTHQVLSFNTSGVTPGAYNYSLSVTSGSGVSVPVNTYIAGTVTAVDLSTSTPTLDIGDLTTSISNLVEVLPANPSS